jgi:hypothetical protein
MRAHSSLKLSLAPACESAFQTYTCPAADDEVVSVDVVSASSTISDIGTFPHHNITALSNLFFSFSKQVFGRTSLQKISNKTLKPQTRKAE